MEISRAMIAITTSNSTRVNPPGFRRSALPIRIIHLALIRSIQRRPGIQWVIVIWIERLPSLAIFKMPVAIDDTASPELGAVDRLPRLIVAAGEQSVPVAGIAIRR